MTSPLRPGTHKYRLWHIPQIPGKAFEVHTDDLAYAKALIDVLADYDLFQYENRIKPDYANLSGIDVWCDPEGEYGDIGLNDVDGPPA